MHKKTSLVPDNPRYAFDQYWYETKLTKYESLLAMFSPPASLDSHTYKYKDIWGMG